jgi:uncharacterized protein (UPF0335 family)
MTETITIKYEDLKKMTEVVNANDLKNTVEKLERLENEKAEHLEVLKDGYAEAKSKGYCTKTLKHILKLRKKDKAKIDEEDALLELYRGALDI